LGTLHIRRCWCTSCITQPDNFECTLVVTPHILCCLHDNELNALFVLVINFSLLTSILRFRFLIFFIYTKKNPFCISYRRVYTFQLISSACQSDASRSNKPNVRGGPVLVTRFPIKIHICSCGNIGKSSSLSDTDINFVIIWDSFGSHTLAINKKKHSL